jgi:hypothetical protein
MSGRRDAFVVNTIIDQQQQSIEALKEEGQQRSMESLKSRGTEVTEEGGRSVES